MSYEIFMAVKINDLQDFHGSGN